MKILPGNHEFGIRAFIVQYGTDDLKIVIRAQL